MDEEKIMEKILKRMVLIERDKRENDNKEFDIDNFIVEMMVVGATSTFKNN